MSKLNNIKDQLNFIKYCIGKRTDARFRNMVYTIGDDYSLVNLERNGENESFKPIYYIAPDASGSGFFADFLRTLAYLYYADYFNLLPVVKYPDGFCYAEDHEILGTTNPYEYYFNQPCGYTIGSIESVKCIIRSRKENAALAGKLNPSGYGYDYSEEFLSEMGRIATKYVSFNSTTQQFLDDAITHIGKNAKVLGVHVRGTDFKRNYVKHPIFITAEEYLAETKTLYSEKKYEKVFLATDDAKAVDLFRSEFGDALIVFDDVVRSDGNETVMKSNDDRENHHYLLGLEVLRDAYTLSRCSGVVAGISQVSTAARIFNRSYSDELRYMDEKILFKGINKSGEVCR